MGTISLYIAAGCAVSLFLGILWPKPEYGLFLYGLMLGFPDLALSGHLGFYGQSDMSAAVLEQIGTDIQAVGKDPAIGNRLAAGGLTVRTDTAPEFRALLDSERQKIAAAAEDGRARPGQAQ